MVHTHHLTHVSSRPDVIAPSWATKNHATSALKDQHEKSPNPGPSEEFHLPPVSGKTSLETIISPITMVPLRYLAGAQYNAGRGGRSK
jgi:hypothetical protein